MAILGNDYQNLSLIRRLRRVDPDKENQGNAPTGPYMAYILDVFNKNGRPLYNQREASHLNQDELTNILEKPHYWRLNGRNTVFLFKDRNYIFRITHKATPLRMLFARYLALFLVMTVIIQAARLSLRPGRGFLSRWRRSFALKLAGFMFLSSVLPTFTSGWLLINSIQRNQTREEESLAQSKIKAARNLFANVRPEMVEQGDRGTVWRSIQPAVWPVQENARILGEDLSLYISGSLSNTSQPEAFSRGVLDRRLDHDLVRKLLVGKSAYVLDRKPLPDGSSMLVAYTVIDQGSNRRGIIGMTMIPFSQRQKFRWWEQLEFSVSILFGLLFMMALLTRLFAQNYLRPVAAITRGAARMAKGLVIRPIRINRQDELDRMVAAFNIMQQRIQRSQARLRDQLDIQDETLKSMSSGLLGFSKTGRIILENNKLWELLRIESERPVNLEDLIDLQPGFAGMKTLFDEGENGEVSFHVGGGGDERELLLKLRMVSTGNGHDIYCIAALEDITDALAAGRFKAWSEMARRVAHEIKNPLTPIQLEMDYLTRLYKDKRPGFEEALDDTAQQIGKQVQDLRRIATEFSDYARPVELEYGEANLANMLEDILDSYRKTMSGVNFSSHLDQEITAMVDERLLKRAINNLVLNAIQAMDEEGDLTLRLYKDADHIHIWVQDTGSGIPEEEHSRIFEAYFSTKDQGTGLGMGIAKRYVDLHGGQLSIDPSWTEGTRFRITLPLQNEERE